MTGILARDRDQRITVHTTPFYLAANVADVTSTAKECVVQGAKIRGAACGAADVGGFGWVAGVGVGAGVV